ncbi:MAG: hypothetical protein HWD92_08115 [Flavobacteriia bacterium]|nr:hypothetical protein [Flavobacteriia bacterium]
MLFLLVLASCSSREDESTIYSYRALSIPSEDIIWAAASEGLVIRSTDAGLTWDTVSVPGYVGEFRDIHAWSDESAVVMGIASPGLVFKTNDGGKSWREVYQQTDEATFFDQMDFNDIGGGIIWGDPIDGTWNIIGTNDFGEHWVRQMSNSISADSGDVSFAASGSALLVNDSNYISFTGGYGGKMYSYKPRTSTSLYTDTSSTSGVYSATQFNDSTIVFVGGDYRFDDLTRNACGVVYMDGLDFHVAWPEEGIRGYRSCVVTVHPKLLISCGPTGMDWSSDGLVWHPLNNDGANVLAVSPKTNRVWAAGKGGIWEVSLPEDAKLGAN